MLNIKFSNFKLEYFQIFVLIFFSYDLTRSAQCKIRVKIVCPVCY